MAWLLASLIFVGTNFLLYTLVLRHLHLFGREGVIFSFQLLSFVSLPILLLTALPPVSSPFAALVAALSLHGIYSMSFLELWSLSEGSYSLRMLDHIDRQGSLPIDADIRDLEKIGASKKVNRLGSLVKLGLIREDNDRYVLKPTGRIAAALLRLLVWTVNIRDRIG